jgi:hypothetical protein
MNKKPKRQRVQNDYLDAYIIKVERDDAVEIIRMCQRLLGEYSAENGDADDLIGRLRNILAGPKAAAITARSDKFISEVS